MGGKMPRRRCRTKDKSATMQVEQARTGGGIDRPDPPAGNTRHCAVLVANLLWGWRRRCKLGVGIAPGFRAEQIAFMFGARGSHLRNDGGVRGGKCISMSVHVELSCLTYLIRLTSYA
jgi:hypothetical protein